MNLRLDPNQFLALYNALSIQLSSTDSDVPGWEGVEEVKKRMEEIILDSLTATEVSKAQPHFSKWADKEQQRIHQLEEDLKTISLNSSNINEIDDGVYAPPQKKVGLKK
jgi:hypothetical protein